MKKIILKSILIFVVIIAFTSCGTKKPTTEVKNTVPTPSPSPQSQYSVDNQKTEIPLRFAVMADSRGLDHGINSEIVAKTLEGIKKISPQPSFAVMPGDLVEGSSSYSQIKAQLQYFKYMITKYYPIDFFYPGFGNHEAIAGLKGEQAFQEVFSEIKANFLDGYHRTAYYFDKNNTRFFMLNSNHSGEDHQISDTQLNWVKANILQDKKHNLYFFHEPAYPTGSHVGSSLDVYKFQRDKLWTVIDTSESPMVFSGHEHNYTRRHINSDFNETINGEAFKFSKLVYQVTTGTFGAPIYKDYTDTKNVDVPPIQQYHFAVVDVTEAAIKVTVYDLNGKVIDNFISNKLAY